MGVAGCPDDIGHLPWGVYSDCGVAEMKETTLERLYLDLISEHWALTQKAATLERKYMTLCLQFDEFRRATGIPIKNLEEEEVDREEWFKKYLRERNRLL